MVDGGLSAIVQHDMFDGVEGIVQVEEEDAPRDH
jgi:hypothetical protein